MTPLEQKHRIHQATRELRRLGGLTGSNWTTNEVDGDATVHAPGHDRPIATIPGGWAPDMLRWLRIFSPHGGLYDWAALLDAAADSSDGMRAQALGLAEKILATPDEHPRR